MKEKSVFCDPDLGKSQIINRYMDLPKFLDLLRTQELHLESADRFEDMLEGTLPESIRQSILELVEKKELKSKPVEDLEYENKIRTNISCWTLGPDDNMALWKIYGGSTQSVAISTTINHMILSAFNWCGEGKINIKKIHYINHAGNLPDGVYALDEHTFGLKHVAYSFEREVRLIITRPFGSPRKIMRLPIDINNFLTKIIVSPESGDWFFYLVVDLAKKYKISAPVEYSELKFLIDKAKK